jgi:superfamily II DNA or RNA helicase
MRPLWAWQGKLRAWQSRAVDAIAAARSLDFLVMATPAAGKTRLALRIAHQALTAGAADRIVVVTPTDHLRTQWATAAAAAGIQLDPTIPRDRWEASDYHGAVATYQQVCMGAAVFCQAANHRRTLVILDEIHHAGDGKDWGTALKAAFEPAVTRLALSGTPFRTDTEPIPFIRYQDGVSVADFSYSYPEAIRDGVCRPVTFHSYEGHMTWRDNDGTHQATFATPLDEKGRSRRLRTALQRQEWSGALLQDADTHLTQLRATQSAAGPLRTTPTDSDRPRTSPSESDRLRTPQRPTAHLAGGLVIAMDQAHARSLAEQLRQITGIQPAIAMSDEPSSSATIERFSTAQDKWLVAVKMVSEGVDIPRLRLLVYCSNVSTEMAFRQAVGRIVRMRPELGRPQPAWMYLPKDPILIDHAQTIETEIRHELATADAPIVVAETGAGFQGSSFIPLGATARADALFTVQATPGDVETQIDPPPPPLHKEKEGLREIHRTLVGDVARKTGMDHRTINSTLCRETGGPIDRATRGQLQKRLLLLERWKDYGRIG